MRTPVYKRDAFVPMYVRGPIGKFPDSASCASNIQISGNRCWVRLILNMINRPVNWFQNLIAPSCIQRRFSKVHVNSLCDWQHGWQIWTNFGIKFCVRLDKTASKTLDMPRKAFGDVSLGRSTVFEWHARFKAGRESIKDDEHTGRPNNQQNQRDCGESSRACPGGPSPNNSTAFWHGRD